MNMSALYPLRAQVFAFGGLLLALLLVAGCGHKAASAIATATTNTAVLKTNILAVAQTNLSSNYISVFENLPPEKGKDPFFPTSTRRNPKVEVAANANAPVDPVLVLKAIINNGKHSQVVINNEIFMVGDTLSVHVPNGHVEVRCIDISSNAVRIQVDGGETTTLTMEEKKD